MRLSGYCIYAYMYPDQAKSTETDSFLQTTSAQNILLLCYYVKFCDIYFSFMASLIELCLRNKMPF